MDPCTVVTALSRPEAYPDRPSGVSLRQTHISWLFFTDRFVYKLKKPVNFGFLDFTSLEARKRFCEEEARLNRRLAPGVYVGVVEVKASEGAIRLGGDGTTVEYALQMHRLPEERMLPAQLARGEVTPETMQGLARLLADFHSHADTGDEVNEGGSLATVMGNWEENFAQTRPYLDFPLNREMYARIRAHVLAFCHTRAGLFEQRIAEGRIRDGHGDLRAEHICLTEPTVIFDCIEFNHRFRHGDVAGDVAFLAMDLDERGFPELSQAFVQAYIECAGDPGLLELLDFYKCYRAFVRAKVECFRSDDPGVPAAEQRAALQTARRYWELAARYAEALRPPWLLLTCGLMGTGKTALAEALAKQMPLAVFNSDATRKRLAGVPATVHAYADYGEGLYTPAQTEETYAQLFRLAEGALARGDSVLLDASFQRARHRRLAREVAQRTGARFRVLECWCPRDEIRRRLDARVTRGGAVSDGRWELLERQERSFEPLFEIPPGEHLRVDTTQPPQAAAAQVVAALGLREPASPTKPVLIQGGKSVQCPTMRHPYRGDRGSPQLCGAQRAGAGVFQPGHNALDAMPHRGE
jgi:aminoglycoside phosphotransferase family enzyme/predicted kinase